MTLKTVFAAVGVALCSLVLMADAPATATWTGRGDRTLLADPDNWCCKDAGGGVMEGKIPSADTTVVTVTGETTFTCPTGTTPIWKTLTVSGAVMLAADCDWCGLALSNTIIAENATIDLKGHKLNVTGMLLETAAHATFTDTAAYDTLAYIQATGTQWIDTGIPAASGDRIETMVNFTDISNIHALWCARATNGQQGFSAFYINSNNPPLRFDHPGGQYIGSKIEANSDCSIVADGMTREVTINGTPCSQKMADGGKYTSPSAMTLFMAFWGDHTNNQSYFARLKCYYFRIYGADGTPKRDLVPARRLSDGAIGLLDRVENVFHENQGSGVFTAGETVTSGTTGELHVDVPPGVTATAGQGNAFTGGLKLVKEGAGTFVPDGTLGYYGGTRIDGGMLRVAEGVSRIGAKGREILVGSGATVEMSGAVDFVENWYCRKVGDGIPV